MVKVELTKHLFQCFPDLEGKTLTVEATTVAEVVRAMEAMAPGLGFYICDERGRLRRHVNIFIGDEPIHDRGTLSDAVGPDAQVFILQALSGGQACPNASGWAPARAPSSSRSPTVSGDRAWSVTRAPA